MDCTGPEFWAERYRANRTPWDMNGVPAPLLAFLRDRSDAGAALIPGCGSAYEVATFHAAGWNVRAVDFAAPAVERAREVLGELGDAVQLADFFHDELGGPFDVIYERTFLCSMPPERWPEYARRMAALLRPGGCLVGVFCYGETTAPPPFFLTEVAAAETLGAHFVRVEDRPIPSAASLPVFAGTERWQVWRRADGRK